MAGGSITTKKSIASNYYIAEYLAKKEAARAALPTNAEKVFDFLKTIKNTVDVMEDIEDIYNDPRFPADVKDSVILLYIAARMGPYSPDGVIELFGQAWDLVNNVPDHLANGMTREEFYEFLAKEFPDHFYKDEHGKLKLVGNPDALPPDQRPDNSDLPEKPHNMPGTDEPVNVSKPIANPNDLNKQAPSQASPLVLDLDGQDGVEVSKLGYGEGSSRTYFDMNNDGFAERTAWVTGGDRLLAIDRNNNGEIDNQSELFGNNTTYADGFSNLKSIDSNNDNKITSADSNWSKLRVWVDADEDGITDSGELKTLAQLGITSINLNAAMQSNLYKNENWISHASTFVMNGQARAIEDVWFRNDAIDTRYTGAVTFDPETLSLPTLKGFGKLKDLHFAMGEDATLLQMVKNFAESWELAKLVNPSTLDNEVKAILFRWAGVENVNPASLGPYVNAQYMAFMEKLTGLTHDQAFKDDLIDGLRQTPAAHINESFRLILNSFKTFLIVQAGGEEIFSNPPRYDISFGDFEGSSSISLAAIATFGVQSSALSNATLKNEYWTALVKILLEVKDIADFSSVEKMALDSAIEQALPSSSWDMILQNIENNTSQMNVLGTDFQDQYIGSLSADYISGQGGDDIIFGQGGTDYIYGDSGHDRLYGEMGDDFIFGGVGNDILNGGVGNDELEGGDGDDTYIYLSGLDRISDYAGADIIKFGPDITASNITLQRGPNLYDLNILLNGQAAIIINGHFQSGYAVEKIMFANGSSLDLVQFSDVNGTAAADTLNGLDRSALLDDVIYGNGGNDTINGLKGNDYLFGGQGNDKYVYSAGAGQGTDKIRDDGGASDSISLGIGYTSSNITLERVGLHDLAVKSAGQTLILIEGQFNGARSIETLVYGNGTTLNLLTYSHTVNGTAAGDTIYGTSSGAAGDKLNGFGGSDNIYAGAGNDTVTGGDGSDNIYGEDGNDTLSGNAGDDTINGGLGNDVIVYESGTDWFSDYGGTDVINIKNSAITAANMTLRRPTGNQENLDILLNGVHAFTIQGQFYQDQGFETIKFSNGATFNLTTVQYTTQGGVGNDTLYGIGFGGNPNDIIKGNAGNDYLYGYEGNDSLTGGIGNDYIDGGIGNDTFYYNSGDGLDKIYDQSGTDIIQLGAGFVKSDLTWQRDGLTNNLILLLKGIQVANLQSQFNQNYQIETVKFADGTTQNLSSLKLTTTGTEGADNISGLRYNASADDTIKALGGDDYIYAYNGNDIITGGKGNDFMDGGEGNDTYIYNTGDGLDTISDGAGADIIQIGTGFAKTDLTFQKSDNDLLIFLKGNQVFSIQSQFINNYGIETIKFSDSSIYDLINLSFTIDGTGNSDSLSGTDAANDTINGFAGNDYLYGYGGNDILDGGSGNDTLDGGAGDDIYNFTTGFGADTISDEGGVNDVINFGSGITAASIRFERIGDDLNIYAGVDKIIIQGQYYDESYGSIYDYEIEKVTLADGTTYNLLGGLTFKGTTASENMTGTIQADVLQGFDGNDGLYGYAGNDQLEGGSGNDTLDGGTGDDIYNFTSGFGADIISDEGGVNDVINFGSGITAASIRFERIGDNLNIYAGVDKIIIKGQYYDESYGSSYDYEIEKVILADATTYNLLGSLTFQGTTAIDYMYGTAQADTMQGLAGNDNITGYGGNDTLDGGTGNDTIDGGAGNDTYVYSGGLDYIYDYEGGNDTLLITGGKTVNDISLTGDDYSEIKVILNVGTNEVTVSYDSNPINKIETIAFDDGFTANLETYKNWIWGTDAAATTNGTINADTIIAKGGNDIVRGGNGNDLIHGGAGDDTLYGANDLDTLFGGLGNDTLYGEAGNDRLYGDAGANKLYGGAGSDIFVFMKASAFDTVDQAMDFKTSEGDKLDISNILDMHNPVTDLLSGFVRITESGTNSFLSIDADGGGNNFVQIAQLTGVTNFTAGATATEAELQALVTNGNLIV